MVGFFLRKEAAMERSFTLLNSQIGENFFRLHILSKAGRFIHLLEDVNCFLKIPIFLSSLYGKLRKTAFLV